MKISAVRWAGLCWAVMMWVSGCALYADNGDAKERLLSRLVDGQTRQEKEIFEIKQLVEIQGEQYKQLSTILETILKTTDEHTKKIREIRNAIAGANKTPLSATRTGRKRAAAPVSMTSKKEIGGVALIRLIQLNITLLARVDTGAETASLDARNIEQFERDGEDWVRFDIPNAKGAQVVSTEHKLSRKVKILQATTETSDRRLVVEIPIEIAGISQVAEFTLTDREHLTYPVLIGRNILKDVMVVDVGLPVPELP